MNPRRLLLAASVPLAGLAALLVLLTTVTMAASRKSSADAGIAGTSVMAAGLIGASGSIPAGYVDAINRAGSACPPLTPAILAGQIQLESSWNPVSVSGAGAKGLAQFLDGTWATYGRDGNGDGIADPFQPLDAIAGAGAYDCANLAAVAGIPGDPIDNMLAAYNAGSGAVAKYRGIPPFPETQAYVPRIKEIASGMAVASGVVRAVGDSQQAVNGLALPLPVSQLSIAKLSAPHHDHAASDLAAPMGTPIYAIEAGIVSTAGGRDQGWGNHAVTVQAADGWTALYGHNSALSVTVGEHVAAGQQIASVGSEGFSTGPHLHVNYTAPGVYPYQTNDVYCPQALTLAAWRHEPGPAKSSLSRTSCVGSHMPGFGN